MWTCDLLAALTAYEKKCGVGCIKKIGVIPYTHIVRIVSTSFEVWDYDTEEKTLTHVED